MNFRLMLLLSCLVILATVSFLYAMEANEAEAAEMEFSDMLRQKIPNNFTKLPPIPEERGRGRHGLLNKF
uniref:Uncharacterized protein n=1 Tax=Anopheles merus TaxID=30066 RepID=A0A182V229_ANOME